MNQSGHSTTLTGPYNRSVPAPFIALLIGLAAGVVSGLFGVGGGTVIVPGLVLALGFAQSRAAATSTAVIVIAAISGLVPFASADQVQWDTAGWLLGGSIVGAVIGARQLDRISDRSLRYGFSGVLVIAAIRLLTTA